MRKYAINTFRSYFFGIIVYRKGNEWFMEDFNRNEIGRKTIDIDADI